MVIAEGSETDEVSSIGNATYARPNNEIIMKISENNSCRTILLMFHLYSFLDAGTGCHYVTKMGKRFSSNGNSTDT